MKLRAALPKRHGLDSLVAAMVSAPQATHLVVGIIDCSRLTTDTDTGEVEPTARLLHIDVVLDQDHHTARQLLRRALDARDGQTVLPIEAEDEIAELGRLIDGPSDDGPSGDAA